jgi:serine protease AprX
MKRTKTLILLIVVTLIFSTSLFLAFNQQTLTKNTLTIPTQPISITSTNSKMGTHLQYLIQTSNPSAECEMLIFFDRTVNYTQGINLLKNLGSFEIISNYTIISGVCIKAPIGMAEKIAQQNYVRTITYNEEVEITPDQVTADGVQAEDAAANEVVGAATLQAAPYNLNGTGVVVAVIDTGINPQTPELDSTRIIWNWSFVTSEGYTDYNGHGTAVAGIIGATGVTNSSVKGVAPAVEFLNLKALNAAGYGQLNWVIEAINEALKDYVSPNPHPKADIISMSLGASYGSSNDDVCKAVNSAWVNNDTIVVVAAGNSGGTKDIYGNYYGPYYGTIASPGLAADIITVGAAGSDNQSVAYFSSRGPTDDLRAKPDILAPGVNLTVLNYLGGIRPTGVSGTSAATPVVSGAIALLLDHNSNVSWVSPNTVKAALMMTAEDLGLNPFGQGAGMLNISRAYNYLQDYYINKNDTTPPLVITPIRALAYPMLLWDLYPAKLVLTVVVGNVTEPIVNASFTVSGNACAFTSVSSEVFSSLNDTEVFVPVSFIVPLWRSVYDFSGNLTLVNGTGDTLFTIPLALNDANYVNWPVSVVLWSLYLNDVSNLSNTAYNVSYLGIGLIPLGLGVTLGLAWQISKRKPEALPEIPQFWEYSPELQQLSAMFIQYCPYCGTKVGDKDFFCYNCGKQIRIRPTQPSKPK